MFCDCCDFSDLLGSLLRGVHPGQRRSAAIAMLVYYIARSSNLWGFGTGGGESAHSGGGIGKN